MSLMFFTVIRLLKQLFGQLVWVPQLGFILGLLWGFAQTTSWAALYSFTWVTSISALTLYSYLSPAGLTLICSIAIFMLLSNVVCLWFLSVNTSATVVYNIAQVGAIVNNYPLTLQLQLDSYSLSYIILTTTIGLFAILFASNYMRNEPRVVQFILLLQFFLLSMILLLASGNFPTLMLGWELIGCFSFLLINFWVARIGTFNSAFKAFTFNKLSDAALILTFLVVVSLLPGVLSSEFNELYLLQGTIISVFGVTTSVLNLLLLMIITCSFCKSAQLGFHAWLPDSMEAPVPASALIHSATLVSAGIFLLGRSVDLILVSIWSDFILVWASMTALYGGVVAAYQTDLNNILAYSTISHCGLLFVLVIYNNLAVLVLYLHLHGWFKSYSFMAAGNIISNYLGYQDMSRMGGNAVLTTTESLVLCISLACLGGLPFLLGFFNNHYLLLLHNSSSSTISQLFVQAAAFTGLFYTQNTLNGLFAGPTRTPMWNFKNSVHGYNVSSVVSSSPYTNIVLFSIYTVFICILSGVVLNLVSLSTNLFYISAFGIIFFYIYFVMWGAFQNVSAVLWLLVLFTINLLYVFFL